MAEVAGAAAADGRRGRGALDDRAHAGRLRAERRFQQRRGQHLPQALGGARPRPRRTWSARSTARSAQIAAVRGNAAVRNSLSRGRGQPVNFVIAGATYADLARARDRIIAAAADNPGIVNLDSDYKETKPQLRIEVDTARAGDLGVSVADVSKRCRPCSARAGSPPMSTAARNIGSSSRPRRARAPPQDESRLDLRAQPHRHAGAALQPRPRPRHGRRARSRPLQQAARDHALRPASRPAIRSARR